MSAGAGAFAARVNLPCRIFYGPDSMLELSGTAVAIDTSSVVLEMTNGNGQIEPELGERVRLELSLPVNAREAGARCLEVRARVAGMQMMRDGSRQVTCTFRKPSFKEQVDQATPKPMKRAARNWKM